MVRVGGVEPREEDARIQDKRHVSARRMGNRIGSDHPCGSTVGGATDSQPGAAPHADGASLLVHSFSQDSIQGDAASGGFSTQGLECLRVSAYRRPCRVHHDVMLAS